jgi:hypothetical protein
MGKHQLSGGCHDRGSAAVALVIASLFNERMFVLSILNFFYLKKREKFHPFIVI